jgi:hypothetical protein
MMTIAQRFDELMRRVMPPDVPPIQRVEMRRAFYAGAKSMLDAGLEIADLSDDDAVVVLQAFHRECHEFGQAVGTPREDM